MTKNGLNFKVPKRYGKRLQTTLELSYATTTTTKKTKQNTTKTKKVAQEKHLIFEKSQHYENRWERPFCEGHI